MRAMSGRGNVGDGLADGHATGSGGIEQRKRRALAMAIASP